MNCPCDRRVWPPKLAIPAGLSDLPRQLVDFLDVKLAMFDRMRHQPALARWSARNADDYGVMLVELWAYVAELLSIYDKAIADESYVRTAKLRTSLRRSTTLLGYVPRPAVAATADIAVLADGAQPVVLPVGMAVRSGAFDGEPPQVFELTAPAVIHPALNRWPLAAPIATTISGTTASLLVEPASIRFALDDAVLIELGGSQRVARRVTQIERVIDQGRRLARVSFDRAIDFGAGVSIGAIRLMRGTRRARVIAASSSVTAEGAYFVLDGNYPDARTGTPVLVERDGEARWAMIDQLGHADVPIGSPTSIPQTTVETPSGNVTIAAHTIPSPTTRHTTLKTSTQLDAPDQLATPTSDTWQARPAEGFTIHVALADGGRVVGPARSTLEPGDPLIATGLRSPIGSTAATTRLALRDAEGSGAVIGGGVDWTAPKLVVDQDASFAPLAVPVEAFGNVVTVVRGETVEREVLGSGDASIAHQSFTLAKKPLTYVAAPDPDGPGVRSTLRVWVDGVEWTEVPSFFGAGPHDPVFVVRQDDDGSSIVRFGDGKRGARLPTGVDNVVASYRFGAGAKMPPAGSITQLAKPVAGVKSVVSPTPAMGGADAEPASSLRELAPRSALLLGRAISIEDMEVAASLVPGVITARADWRWEEIAQRPVVKVWFVATGDLAPTVARRLRAISDPSTPIHVAAALPIRPAVAVDLELDSRRIPEEVLQAVNVALLGEDGCLTPAALGIGRPVIRSRLVAALLAVPGVTGVRSLHWDGAPLSGYGVSPGDGAYFDLATTLTLTGS